MMNIKFHKIYFIYKNHLYDKTPNNLVANAMAPPIVKDVIINTVLE